MLNNHNHKLTVLLKCKHRVLEVNITFNISIEKFIFSINLSGQMYPTLGPLINSTCCGPDCLILTTGEPTTITKFRRAAIPVGWAASQDFS